MRRPASETLLTATLAALAIVALAALAACGATPAIDPTDGAHRPGGVGGKADGAGAYNELNLAAGGMVLYEVQARTANACRTDTGSPAQRAACAAKVAPTVTYHGQGTSCGALADLQRVRLGTLDDLGEDTSDDRLGITLRYVSEKVGANTLWLMPIFPDNDAVGLPDACDNLGSPYAVRDYLHASGMLSRACIQAGRDERSTTPCWGNDAFDALVQKAHARGLRVMLDVAFNHFGHEYELYDYAAYTPIRERLARHEDPARLWDYAATAEDALVHPTLLDTPAALAAAAAADPLHRSNLAALQKRCPSLAGPGLVRAYGAWQEAFDWERAAFDCGTASLEVNAPGFYLGANHWDPSTRVGDNFTNNWSDVKFLFHHETNTAHSFEFVRQREYLFRVMNYWASRGVDAFRLDHTTDWNGGMSPNEWRYIVSKVDYYNWRRGQPRPVYLAEEFGDQLGMSHVVDVMTEGYITDMDGRNGATKDASYAMRVLDNAGRFGGHTFVMTALEDHDEKRLTDGTGFNVWTGAGFWALGATAWSTPMMLMGQEFGEPQQLDFRRSAILRGRFVGTSSYAPQGDALAAYYRALIGARLDPKNRALLAPNHAFLPMRDAGAVDPRIVAEVKWSDDGNVLFAFHNLWEQPVAQSYYIPPAIAAAIALDPARSYRLVDAIGGAQVGPCRRGADLAWSFYVGMDAGTRLQWLRLELCP